MSGVVPRSTKAPRGAKGPGALDAKHIAAALRGIAPEPYPPRHQLHKYWGKKPANVVGALIELFTRPGALVVDPFAGSGVTLVEAVRLGRRAEGVELSPVAARLGRLLLDPPPSSEVDRAARAIVAELSPLAASLYEIRCTCGARGPARAFTWAGATLAGVAGTCASCGRKIDRAPSREDRARAAACVPPPSCPDAPVPDAWQMRKLHRAGLTKMSELFTSRNLAMSAALRTAILGANVAPRVREALMLTFTANLAQCSRMIADFKGRAGGPSWKLNSYWLPERAQELNVLDYFENRVAKTLRALEDLEASPSRAFGTVHTGDARTLPIDDGRAAYVLTDPPYGGEGIQYGELAYLWNLWLDEPRDLAREITFNPGRNKPLDRYADDLLAAFRECRRVLAPGGMMTVAFANRDPKVWAVLRTACLDAGFELVAETEIGRSAPGLTQHVAEKTTKTDRLLHFRRAPTRRRAVKDPKSPSLRSTRSR